LAGAAVSLAGCLESRTHLSRDFGMATDQALVAQIADPDARYAGDPAPGTDGARAAGAQERYRAGKVIAPVPLTAGPIGAGSGPSPKP
jgi:type IV pilus biogenesis protein CpaD/CtpE